MTDTQAKVLILGSAPSALTAKDWERAPFTHIVAINNAWRIRDDWDVLIYPEDFPASNRPQAVRDGQRSVSAAEYVPVQNRYGGFVYAGGTMAFTAGYWAMSEFRPSVLAYYGCDMVYPATGKTHFYGSGAADPLREDVTLRSLEAKSARLGLFAAAQGCHAVRLSKGPSRLVFASVDRHDMLTGALPSVDGMKTPLRVEEELGYFCESGRYWEEESRFDPGQIDALDKLWLSAYQGRAIESAA